MDLDKYMYSCESNILAHNAMFHSLPKHVLRDLRWLVWNADMPHQIDNILQYPPLIFFFPRTWMFILLHNKSISTNHKNTSRMMVATDKHKHPLC